MAHAANKNIVPHLFIFSSEAVIQKLWGKMQNHQKMLVLLSRQTLHCSIKLCILQWNRFVDTVVLQIMKDDIVCTNYAVSPNDCCEQKQVWIWICLFLSVYFCLCSECCQGNRSQPNFPHVIMTQRHTHTHATTSLFLIFLLSKGCETRVYVCCVKICFSASSWVCSVYETWYVTATHSQ